MRKVKKIYSFSHSALCTAGLTKETRSWCESFRFTLEFDLTIFVEVFEVNRHAAVELDAIEPDMLRQLVRNAIEHHLPRHQLEVMKSAEASEREGLEMLARRFRGGVY